MVTIVSLVCTWLLCSYIYLVLLSVCLIVFVNSVYVLLFSCTACGMLLALFLLTLSFSSVSVCHIEYSYGAV